MRDVEREIKDLFENFELQVDSEEIWKGVEDKLNKKKRRFFFLWFLLPFAMVIGAGMYFKLSGGVINSSKTINNSTGIGINKPKNEMTVSSYLKENIVTDIKDIKTLSNTEINHSVKNQNRDLEGRSEGNLKKNEIINTPDKNQHNFAIIEDGTHFSSHNKDVEMRSQNINKTNESEKLNINSDNYSNLTNISRLPLKSFGVLSENANYIMNKDIQYKTFDKQIIKEQKWFSNIDAGFGVGIVSKSLLEKGSGFENYKTKRKETEKFLESFAASCKYQLRHKSGFFLNSGLEYVQIDEKFVDIDSVDLYKTQDGVIKIVHDNTGNTTELRGQKDVVEHHVWNKNIYNYYSFIEIPLEIGYSFGIKKLSYEISSGISYNIAFFKKGQVIGLYGYPVSLSDEIYKVRSGFSFTSAMKVIFPYKNMSLFAEPTFRYNINEITNSEYPLAHKNYIYGLRFGLRLKI